MKKNAFGIVALGLVAFVGMPASGEAPVPEVEYALRLEAGACSPAADTIAVGLWVKSNAEHGISCAFVDLTTNATVVAVVFSEDFAMFRSAEVDEFGVVNLGGCTLVDGGAGQAPEWSLVATVEVESARHIKRFRASVDVASHPLLGTSIYGEGNAEDIDYGKAARCHMPVRQRSEKDRTARDER